MSDAMESIVNAYVRMNNRPVLEEMASPSLENELVLAGRGTALQREPSYPISPRRSVNSIAVCFRDRVEHRDTFLKTPRKNPLDSTPAGFACEALPESPKLPSRGCNREYGRGDRNGEVV